MATIGFHASHEQLSPRALLTAVQRAEEAGFDAVTCSDHFAPWSVRQGHSGHAWARLGSVLQATALPFGVVTAPGQRYHPAIAAQAMATLAEMYPGRFWAALGSGEALNEHITGDRWPDKPTRDARLLECVAILRALLRGEEAAFRDGGGEGKPALLQVHLSWAETEEEALAVAHDQWRTNAFSSELAWNLEFPEQFDAAAAHVRPDDLRGAVLVSADPGQHAGELRALLDLGFDGLSLHHVGRDQDPFIDVFGAKVVPELR